MNKEKKMVVTAKSRARGRPRKESDDEPKEDKRARGRQAQKNYQLRKQAEASGLKTRIAFLEDAIETMSNEFIEFGDRVVTFQDHPLILKDLRETTKRFLDIARTAESLEEAQAPNFQSAALPANQQDQDTKTFEPSPSRGSATPKAILQSYFHERTPLATSTFDFNTLLAAATPPSLDLQHLGYDQPPQFNISGRFSPRLGYGMLGSHPLSNPIPESIWSHYLVSGPNSFAMRLYEDAMTLVLSILKGHTTMPGFIPSIGRFRFRHEDPRSLVELLDERIALAESEENVQTNQPSMADSDETSVVLFGPKDPLMSSSLRRNIFTDAAREMGSIREWLDPFGAQDYLNKQWGMQLTSATAQVSTHTLRALNIPVPIFDPAGQMIGVPGDNDYSYDDSLEQGVEPPAWGLPAQQPIYQRAFPASSELQRPEVARHFNLAVDAGPLASTLIRDSLCFGEGPRFFKQNIDKAAINFLSGISNSEGMLALPT